MADLYYPEKKDPYTANLLVDIFGKKLRIYSVDNWFEYFSYWAIWILPLLLMLLFGLKQFRKMC